MKKFAALLILLPLCCSAYNWTLFGPSGIVSTNICFNVDPQQHDVICTNTGMYLNDGPSYTWLPYSYGNLPVVDAAPLDAGHFLVAAGNGSFSDGIYSFDINTHQFSIVEWAFVPRFLFHCDGNSMYYMGYQGGLLTSPDGLTWTAEAMFNGMDCLHMDEFGSNLAISVANSTNYIYSSNNLGSTWNPSVNAPPLTDIAFDLSGDLYGIFPGNSNSSGIWKSLNYGMNWSVLLWADNMSCTGVSAVNTILVGWNNAAAGYQGIATIDPVSANLIFLNNNLPDLHIFRIKRNPVMSSITIFCCTMNGVYFSNDFLTGIPSPIDPQSVNFEVTPEPVGNRYRISYFIPASDKGSLSLSFYDVLGRMILQPVMIEGIPGSHHLYVDATKIRRQVCVAVIAGTWFRIVRKVK
jgi:hypothetical protein